MHKGISRAPVIEQNPPPAPKNHSRNNVKARSRTSSKPPGTAEYPHKFSSLVQKSSSATHPAASSPPPCAAARRDKKHPHSDTPAETWLDNIQSLQTVAASRSSLACR